MNFAFQNFILVSGKNFWFPSYFFVSVAFQNFIFDFLPKLLFWFPWLLPIFLFWFPSEIINGCETVNMYVICHIISNTTLKVNSSIVIRNGKIVETRAVFSWILILTWNFGGRRSGSASTLASTGWFWWY